VLTPSLTDMEQMSGPPDRPQHAVPAVVAGCATAVDQVAEASLWSLGDAELLALLDDAYALLSRVHALALSAVAEADARGLDERVGAPSLAVPDRSTSETLDSDRWTGERGGPPPPSEPSRETSRHSAVSLPTIQGTGPRGPREAPTPYR
jgi:hypothetical protein